MLIDIPDVLSLYLQCQPRTIEPEVTSLSWFAEDMVEFLVESLKHGVSDGCQKIHRSLLGITLYPFSPIIPDSTPNFTHYFDKVKIVHSFGKNALYNSLTIPYNYARMIISYGRL